ncbi:MAG: DUF5009 domain-containing protein [Candidatus Hydrogenedentes bacterium]|nr:DUF5009 domain-containing protein [Candidatus Hydrogenedentota bacterium]
MSTPATEKDAPERILAIDALRGFDMFWITGGDKLFLAATGLLFLKFPGVQAALDHQLHHAPWGERLVFYDLIMPLFLFIVGAAMPFSFSRRLERGDAKGAIYRKIASRTAILFVLGMAAQGNLLRFDLAQLHIYCNTLQAIAAGYAIGGVIMLNTGVRGQCIATAALLIGFWGLLAFAPVPGHAAGVLEKDANIALYVDDMVLRQFSDGKAYTWVLSSLGFAATVLFGILSGHVLRSEISGGARLARLIAAGVALVLIGEVWNLFHPVIKYIWTPSMVVWTAGWCCLLLGLFYFLIDLRGYRKWAFPFVVLGANAIVAYMAPNFIRFGDISAVLFSGPDRLGVSGDLLRAAGAFLLLWAPLYWMYKKKMFVRI